MKAGELRELTPAELQGRLEELRKEQFGYRMQKATGQLGQPHLAAAVRKDIARIKTVLAEKAAAETALALANQVEEGE
ncbi:MAG: 50S ribosomal protein L29 [Gammaproteobacteria bacterium]|nr:50S ribosomal protein L29 [Gammaproteobacteria bacterium]MCY4181844.1 50S ribosomal protein L29 [Gammaproteobacteria bacterium]MCY4269110.1 50S ribosomal protein L29 [Gammaproteobacteria bacterium]MCY4295978.1 50S ribosomal protein L29 [Gammaproteobacteria bacterium]